MPEPEGSFERQGNILFIDAVNEIARERGGRASCAPIIRSASSRRTEPLRTTQGLSAVVRTADVLTDDGSLSIARYVKKAKTAGKRRTRG